MSDSKDIRPKRPYVKRLLARTPSGGRVDALDEMELRALIAYHPSATTKIGSGIDHFMVEGPPYSKHFVIVRTDGTSIDFSYHRCYGSDKPDTMGAARKATTRSVLRFRDGKRTANGTFICELTGEEIDKVEIDHHPTGFLEIFTAWKRERGLSDENIPLMEGPGGIGKVFADDAMRDDFIAYHDSTAKLRVLCPPCHKEETRLKQSVI